MKVSQKLINELQNRLKVGSCRVVNLNAIPDCSCDKFDLLQLSAINENPPNDFVEEILTQLPLRFKISGKANVLGLNSRVDKVIITNINYPL